MTRAVRVVCLTLVVTSYGCGAELAWYGHTRDRRWRIEVRQAGQVQWLSVEGHRSCAYDAIVLGSITTPARGTKLAFAGMRRDKDQRERWHVVVDFVESPAWDGIGAIVFDRSGRRLAYLAERRGRWRAVVDGHEHATFDDIDAQSLQFAPDGARVAYIAFDGSCVRSVKDGIFGPCHLAVQTLVLGRDAAHDIVIERVNDTLPLMRVLVGGTQHARHDQVRDVQLSPREQTVVYAAREGEDWFIMTGAVRGPAFRDVEAPVMSGDGRHVGYIGHGAEATQVVLDGKVVRSLPARSATALALSPDGRRVAFLQRARGGWRIVVDGSAFPFDVVIGGSLRFSDDGRHWAALVGSLAERRLSIVVDGRSHLPFDSQELFGGGLGERAALPAIGEWVYGELERHLHVQQRRRHAEVDG